MTRNLAALALVLGLAATAAWAAKTPHGGTMFAPSAGKHVYHLELVPKDGDKAVIYVLAKDEKTAVPIKDKKFTQGLRAASALNVVGAGATIKVPLDKSTAAFERLDECVEKNSRAVETNPFVAPARQP